jgi:hypothetical protein
MVWINRALLQGLLDGFTSVEVMSFMQINTSIARRMFFFNALNGNVYQVLTQKRRESLSGKWFRLN